MGVDEKDNLKVETETVICAAKEEALRRKRVRNKNEIDDFDSPLWRL